MRAFIFTVWIHAGKTSDATLAALETLAAKQYTVAEQGGRYVVSASVQNKSFTYELPQGQTGLDFAQSAYDAWRMVKIGGTNNAQMTDAQLDAYLCDTDGENTDRTVASFAQYTNNGY